MQVTIQQPPYNSTLYCQILTAMRGGDCANRQCNIRKCPQCRLLNALKQSGVFMYVCMYNRTMGVRGVTKWSMTGLLRYKVSTLG
jgi:hypothetical protein